MLDPASFLKPRLRSRVTPMEDASVTRYRDNLQQITSFENDESRNRPYNDNFIQQSRK